MGTEGLRHRVFRLAAIGLAISATAARAQDNKATGDQTPAPQSAPTAVPPPQTVPPSADPLGLDPESPLAPMPDLGVAWPDLDATPEAEAAPDQPASPAGAPASTTPPAQGESVITTAPVAADKPAVQADIAANFRYTVKITGLDDDSAKSVTTRFDGLSVLHANQKKPANVAQVDRRAREDAKLLEDVLRAEGYYDASVDPGVAASGDQTLLVTLAARPGQLYHFTNVDVTGLASTGAKQASLLAALGLKVGDAINADKVLGGETALTAKLGEEGYPFAKLGDPQIVVDHDSRSGTFALNVDPGGARNFGKIIVPPDSIFKAGHVQTIARFEPGEPYQASRVDDLRRALIQTGLISSVKIEPVPGATDDTVDISVKLERAPPRTISGELGYGTGEGARAAVSWQHRNLISPEGAVTVRAVAGTQEQSFGATLRQSNFNRRDHVLTAQVVASHVDRNAYDAKTLDIGAGIERQTNIIFQKKWTWSLGGDLTLSDERDTVGPTATPRRRTFFIASVPGTLSYDGTDDLLNPTRGFRLGGRLSPEVSFQSGTFAYGRAQVDASAYQPFGDRVVLAGRIRLGTIIGASADRIAPSRRFYSGGGGSVRGYGYQLIGPRDANNDPIGGRSLAEFGVESRIRFGAFGLVPFLDGGNIYRSEYPTFSGMRYGAGLGVRYYTNFGPIRIDVGTPINPQPGDSRVTVYVSLGQAF
jgi:translocation and assembly module TamA